MGARCIAAVNGGVNPFFGAGGEERETNSEGGQGTESRRAEGQGSAYGAPTSVWGSGLCHRKIVEILQEICTCSILVIFGVVYL